jgi:hypothetical protein
MELVPTVGAEVPAVGLSVEVPAGAVGAPMGAIETTPEPTRKRKWDFSKSR